jgi:hypothetical protein
VPTWRGDQTAGLPLKAPADPPPGTA